MTPTHSPADDAIRYTRLAQLRASGEDVRIRQASGWTQQDVANRVRVTQGAVSLWESRVNTPRGLTALAYLDLLDELAAELPVAS